LSNGAILDDLVARFKVKPGDDINYRPLNLFAAAAANHGVP